MSWFKKPKYTTLGERRQKEMPDGLWIKCPDCDEMLYKKDLEKNFQVCPKCDCYFRLTARERINILFDPGTFSEIDSDLESCNPLEFVDYDSKLEKSKKKTGLLEGVITGQGKMAGRIVNAAIFDYNFMGGSMGSVVGEKVTRIAEKSLAEKIPYLVIAAGGGGARMQEGILSLMQMAKTSAIMAKLKENGVPYVCVLTHPTMGGVAASFASLGDLVFAEPKALIGFAGPRVIEQTIGQRLPDGFQTSEFLLDHGMIDAIVERKELKSVLCKTFEYFCDN